MALAQLDKKALTRLQAAVFVLALSPLVNLSVRGLIAGLGANPIETIERTLGYWTLTFLLMTLAVTPLRRWLGWPWLGRFRRLLGLFAFFYASLHFSAYLVLDQFFDWTAIAADIAKRPYLTVGFPAFVLMIPLAVTSTRRMMQRLGGQRWQRLHRLVYLIAVGGVVHYAWLVKKDLSGPVLFAAVLTLLLGYRIVHAVRRRCFQPAAESRGALPHPADP